MKKWVAYLVMCCGLMAAPIAALGEQDIMNATDLIAAIEQDKAPIILDVRSKEEFSQGRVPTAINIPHTSLVDRIGELAANKDDTIVVYCQRGGRAAKAEEILRENGFSNVVHLEGDMAEWTSQKLPVEVE